MVLRTLFCVIFFNCLCDSALSKVKKGLSPISYEKTIPFFYISGMRARFRILCLMLLLMVLRSGAQTLVVSHSPTACAGIPFHLNALFNSPTPVSYSWSASGNATLISASGVSCSVLSPTCGPAAVTCSVFNATNNLLGQSSVTIQVLCSGLSISPASATLCGPANLVLTAAGASSYSWSTGSSATSLTLTPLVSTIYTVSSSGSACPALSTVLVRDVMISANPASLCPGGTTTLSASGGAGSYNWFQPPGVFIPNGTSTQVITQPSSLPATYTVYAFYSGNCIRSATFAVQEFSYCPQVSGSTSVCPGGTLSLTGIAANSYTWSSGTQSFVAANFSIAASSAGSYTLQADSAGCRGQRIITSSIYPLPTVQISSTTNTICNGQSALLFASGAVNYTWTYAPGLLSSLYGASVIASPVVTTNYSVTGISAQGCRSSTSLPVYFSNYPVVSFFTNVNAVCPGYSATAVGQGAISYFWKSLALPQTLVGNSAALPAGAYTLVGSNGGGCRDSLNFVIQALSPLSISITPSDTMTCLYEDGSVYPVRLLAIGAPSYSWLAIPAPASGTLTGFNITTFPSVTTCYTVTGYSSSCHGTASICVLSGQVCTGLKEQNSQDNLQFFYDPYSSVIRFSQTGAFVQIRLRDISGRVVLEKIMADHLPLHELQTGDLPSGFYLVDYRSDTVRSCFSFIKP